MRIAMNNNETLYIEKPLKEWRNLFIWGPLLTPQVVWYGGRYHGPYTKGPDSIHRTK
jgi:hypothetical protein